MSLISHRGAKGLAPENTLASIQIAASLGIPYIEFDIQHTSDNQLVLFHNAKTNSDSLLSELSYSQIQQSYPSIALLADALQACGKSTPLVEIKTLETAKLALPLLKKHAGVAVTSFISEEIIFLRNSLPKSQAFIMQHKQPYGLVKKALKIGATGIGINKNWAFLMPYYYLQARRNGLEIYTFTVNSTLVAALFLRIMPQIHICTDYPDKLQKVSTHLRFITITGLFVIGLCIFIVAGGFPHA